MVFFFFVLGGVCGGGGSIISLCITDISTESQQCLGFGIHLLGLTADERAIDMAFVTFCG